MRISFDDMPETGIPRLNGGAGVVSAKLFMTPASKIMQSRLPAGASIGMHPHPTSSGTGKVICDGIEEELTARACHYCPKGSSHSILNTGTEDLVLFTVVSEQ